MVALPSAVRQLAPRPLAAGTARPGTGAAPKRRRLARGPWAGRRCRTPRGGRWGDDLGRTPDWGALRRAFLPAGAGGDAAAGGCGAAPRPGAVPPAAAGGAGGPCRR